MDISIDKSKCIECRACATACSPQLFDIIDDKVVIARPNSCFVCGHCVAICPVDAISHSSFGADKVHTIEKPKVDAQELLQLIRLRRSNRTFSNKEIPQESLDMIIEAAFRAPTASNIQGLKFMLIQDRATLDGVIDGTLGYFKRLLTLIDNPIVRPIATAVSPTIKKYIGTFNRAIENRQIGKDPILRNSNTLLLIYTDKSLQFGRDDANLAYQNASLMAETLGVSQVYTGFVCMVARRSNIINKVLGLDKKYQIQAGMMLGIPKWRFNKYIDKKEIDFTTVTK